MPESLWGPSTRGAWWVGEGASSPCTSGTTELSRDLLRVRVAASLWGRATPENDHRLQGARSWLKKRRHTANADPYTTTEKTDGDSALPTALPTSTVVSAVHHRGRAPWWPWLGLPWPAGSSQARLHVEGWQGPVSVWCSAPIAPQTRGTPCPSVYNSPLLTLQAPSTGPDLGPQGRSPCTAPLAWKTMAVPGVGRREGQASSGLCTSTV